MSSREIELELILQDTQEALTQERSMREDLEASCKKMRHALLTIKRHMDEAGKAFIESMDIDPSETMSSDVIPFKNAMIFHGAKDMEN